MAPVKGETSCKARVPPPSRGCGPAAPFWPEGAQGREYTQFVTDALGSGCIPNPFLCNYPLAHRARLPRWRPRSSPGTRSPRSPSSTQPPTRSARSDRQLVVRRDRRLRGTAGRDVPGQVDQGVLLPIRRPECSRPEQPPSRLPIRRSPRHGTSVPVAERQHRKLASVRVHPRRAAALTPDGHLLGGVQKEALRSFPWVWCGLDSSVGGRIGPCATPSCTAICWDW
jgi:hypothetical protein